MSDPSKLTDEQKGEIIVDALNRIPGGLKKILLAAEEGIKREDGTVGGDVALAGVFVQRLLQIFMDEADKEGDHEPLDIVTAGCLALEQTTTLLMESVDKKAMLEAIKAREQ